MLFIILAMKPFVSILWKGVGDCQQTSTKMLKVWEEENMKNRINCSVQSDLKRSMAKSAIYTSMILQTSSSPHKSTLCTDYFM